MSENYQNISINSNKRIIIIIGIVIIILLALLTTGRLFKLESPALQNTASPTQNLQDSAGAPYTPTEPQSTRITDTQAPTLTPTILIPTNTIVPTSTQSVVYYPPTSTKKAKKFVLATSTGIPNSATPDYAQPTYAAQTQQAMVSTQTQQSMYLTQTQQAAELTPTIYFTETPD